MNKTPIVPDRNSLEDNRFQSISDFKWCMKRNGEVQFRWKGILYTIVHVNDKIVVSVGYYKKGENITI